MSAETLNVRGILQRGGGPEKLSKRSEALAARGKLQKPIAEKTIYSWFGNGFPEKNWSFVMGECSVTEEVLHRANEALRKAAPRSNGSAARAA